MKAIEILFLGIAFSGITFRCVCNINWISGNFAIFILGWY